MENRRLEQLAALYGVEPSYYDIKGRLQVASRDALVAMLDCLGCTVTTDASIPELVRLRQAELADRLTPRVGVRWGTARDVSLRVRKREAAARATLVLGLEDGRTVEWTAALDDAKAVRQVDVGGDEYVDFAVTLPKPVGVGYHRIEARVGGRSASGAFWVAPDRAYADTRRGFGVFAPTYALKSARNGGRLSKRSARALTNSAVDPPPINHTVMISFSLVVTWPSILVL